MSGVRGGAAGRRVSRAKTGARPFTPPKPSALSLIDKKNARRYDDCLAYSLVSSKKALIDAGLEIGSDAFNKLNKQRCGVLVGSGMGGLTVFQDGVKNMIEKGFKKISPFFIPYAITNMGGALVGIETGFMGPNYSISTACATANYAFVSAANHIRAGDADLIIVGGSEAPIIPVGVGGFVACRALSSRTDEPQRASRPWDQGRDGFVMGEGAGVLIFESLAHAQARGATPIAEYLGGAITCDAYHMTDPRADGLGVSSCIELALKDSGVERDAVNYINAHATSTLVGDIAEVKAVKKVFSNTKGIAMNGTKSMIGHGLGAAGGLEAIAVIKAITTGWVHPTINQEDQIDEVADINTVPNTKQEHKVRSEAARRGAARRGAARGRPPDASSPPTGHRRYLQLVRLWRPQLGRRVCPVQGVSEETCARAAAPARRGGRGRRARSGSGGAT